MSPSVEMSMPLLFCAGAMHIAYNSSNNTILQMTVDDAYRGRILSTLFMSRGLISLGTATMTALAAIVGARWAMGSMAAIVVCCAVLLWFLAPTLRNLKV
jgi:MFS transporter, DHA1 family, staphyloferrin A biosynthesis exporter